MACFSFFVVDGSLSPAINFADLAALDSATADILELVEDSKVEDRPFLGQTLLAMQDTAAERQYLLTSQDSDEFSDPKLSAACEDGSGTRWKKFSVAFASHHKTGTVLMRQAQKCLVEEHEGLVLETFSHWSDKGVFQNHTKVVHWARNPFDMVVSAYLYHRDTGEDWCTSRGSAREIVGRFSNEELAPAGISNAPGSTTWPPEEESYLELLRRIPTKRGLQLELLRFLRPVNPIKPNELVGKSGMELRTAYEACAAEPKRCRTVCLESFTTDSKLFMTSWRRVLRYIGVCLNSAAEDRLRDCLRRADITAGTHPPRVSLHMTRNNEKIDYIALGEMVRKFDHQFHGGAVADLERLVGCHAA